MPMIFAILIGLAFFGVLGSIDVYEENLSMDNYCAMVNLHMQNKNEGWPDYEGVYESECAGK